MASITRRRFAEVLGLVAAGGVFKAAQAQAHGEEHTVPAKPVAGPPKPVVAPAKPVVAAKPTAAAAAKPAPAPLATSVDVVAVDRSTASPEELWQDLMAGNERFAAGKPAPRDIIGARAKTSQGQHPYVIVLCCSDSRLSPELIFDQNIGDLFVVRTAGNVADPIALGSMEYAVEHLGSRMLIVLGHEKCGAVSATLSGEAMPTPNLTALVQKIKPGIDRLKTLVQGETLMSLAVEANVHHSSSDVIEQSPIIRHEIATGKFAVAKAVYDISTGQVRRLGGNFDADAKAH